MKQEKRHIRVCPRCGGIDIGIPPAGLDLRMTMRDYCRNCKNIGNFPEVDIDDVKEFIEEIRKRI